MSRSYLRRVRYADWRGWVHGNAADNPCKGEAEMPKLNDSHILEMDATDILWATVKGAGLFIVLVMIVWGSFEVAALIGMQWYVAATLILLLGRLCWRDVLIYILGDHLNDLFFALSRDIESELKDVRRELSASREKCVLGVGWCRAL